MKKLDKLFILAIGIIVLVVLFGTAIAFVSGNASPGGNLRRQDPPPTSIANSPNSKTSVYTQIGTLRCSTSDDPAIPLVVSPYFPYPTDDVVFYEELFKKNLKLRSLITSYFENFTQKELLETGEQNVKQELITIINAELVLGSIDTLYFAEYIFLE